MTSIETRFAICVVQDDDGGLLLVKRAAYREFNPGLWGFPGGHIEDDESPLDCAWRELYEELGPDNEVNLLKVAGPFLDRHYGGRLEAHLFLYHWQGGHIELDHEHTAYEWVAPDKLKYYSLMPGITDNLIHLGLITP